MSHRVFNFNPGPATLPEEVLRASADALLEYGDTGMGVAELSHRSREFDAILDETIQRLRDLLGIPSEYDVLFLQGGATQLFSTIPMNILQGTAEYVVTGDWSKRAVEGAQPYGDVRVIASSEDTGFDRVPAGWKSSADASYLYICTNETINGVRWSEFPEHPTLVADVSSEFLARPMDVRRFAIIYGGAQKNLGLAGLVIAVVRRDLYQRIPPSLPAIFSFQANAKAKSCLNTPPTFAIYVLLESLRWLERQGGLAAMEERNERKASLIYRALDDLPEVYRPTVCDVPNRSRMNITFRLVDEALTKPFLAGAQEREMVGLAGYRTVGGVRASVYNALPEAACQGLASYMREFAQAHG